MPNDTVFEGRIPATVALALLESLRDVDTPTDPGALAESDLPLMLKRRLGLSRVIVNQIRRYDERRDEDIPAAEVASLFELISRRSDATRIFVEAGQRIARSDLASRRPAARLAARMLPQPLRERGALRRVRRIARSLSPRAEIRLRHKPHGLTIRRGLPSRAAEGGEGCAVLAGAIQYVFSELRAGDVRVVHARCEGREHDHCEWLLRSDGLGGEGADVGGSPEG